MGKVNIKGIKSLDELVITPGGLRPKKNVHLVESGFDIVFKDGVLLKVAKESKIVAEELGVIDTAKPEHFINRNLLRKPAQDLSPGAEVPLVRAPVTDKWIVYAGWPNSTELPISYFSATWEVPPPPATDNGQLIYLFNGIEDSSFKVILQPVLQWGYSPAGGGSFWSIANWFVGSAESGIALHSPLVQVNSGDILQGEMTLVGRSGSQFSYLSAFAGISDCNLQIRNIDELRWANIALECYGLKQFSDYPNADFTSFDNIEVLVSNTQAPLAWEPHNNVTDNGQHCSIISDASPGGTVRLFYRQQTLA